MAACLKAKLVRGAKAAQAVEEAARSTPENIVKVFIGGKSKTNRIFGKRTCGLLLWRLANWTTKPAACPKQALLFHGGSIS